MCFLRPAPSHSQNDPGICCGYQRGQGNGGTRPPLAAPFPQGFSPELPQDFILVNATWALDLLGTLAPWQGGARAIQCFGDEPFPRIKKVWGGLGKVFLIYFRQLLGPSVRCNAPTFIPISLCLDSGTRWWWLLLQFGDVLIFWGRRDAMGLDFSGALLLLRGTSRITAFPIL